MKSNADTAFGRSDLTRSARSFAAAQTQTLCDVVVVGGGIVGAAAALGAAQAGLTVSWIAGARSKPPTRAVDGNALASLNEPAKPRWDSRVYALNPGTRRFLETIRVWQRLDASRVAAVRDMRVFGDRYGRSRLHFGAYEAASEALAWIVEHRELAHVLETAAAYSAAIERFEEQATDVQLEADGLAVTTTRGMRRGRLLIAADGAQSPMRTALAVKSDSKAYGQTAIVANFSIARANAGTAYQWFTDEGIVALLPLPDDAGRHAVSLVWSAPSALADALMAGGADALARRAEAIAGASLGAFAPLSDIVGVPLATLAACRLIASRAALVGDAAHVVHPLAGQGLNLGLQDVETLVELLAAREPFRDCGDAILLRRYERARAAPVAAMRRTTDGLARLFAIDNPAVARLRESGMQIVDRLPLLKRVLVRHAMG